MNIKENFKIAIESVKANKMRSFLTMLGIIIGISSVIAIVSLGQGGQNAITGEFEKIGAASVSIKVNQQKADKSDYITLKDVEQIKERIPTVKYVSPTLQKQGIVSSDIKSKRAFITGANEDYGNIGDTELIYGRYFNREEYLEGKPTIVIDNITAKALFGYEDAVGKTVNLGAKIFPKKATIIGISKNQMGMFGGADENMPAMISAPATFVQQLYPSENLIESIVVVAVAKEDSENAGNGAISILENRHNNAGRDIYSAESLLKQLDQINKVLGIFTAFISAVAGISLLVGGIGVMNIMLVSVTERTREIGIRKAIGATTRNILMQFLTESLIIALIGGIIGMILGILGSYFIGSFAGITPVVSPKVILAVILFSSAVGIFFGIYPAKKAADLDPIDALRHE
ncbi:ABC transporter permease [Clostridium sp. CX1]|uniref:ABC transporter permease n=1 Tax=Clostridium sp. CX1 TaxID=2978346 RepID=UPI0021BF952F|nr:ABC transporter permease [Clostridium sp. CX1]MCT8975228.1 ABC transporter permease [Clostridium sp. CX1]